jgi:hypothetical protein
MFPPVAVRYCLDGGRCARGQIEALQLAGIDELASERGSRPSVIRFFVRIRASPNAVTLAASRALLYTGRNWGTRAGRRNVVYSLPLNRLLER